MDPPNRGPELAAVSILFMVVDWIIILLRCYVRIRITKRFFLDDWLAMLSLVLFTVNIGFGLHGINHGIGRHMKDVPLSDIKAAMLAWYFCPIFFVAASAVLRVAVGAFLMRFASSNAQRTVIFALCGVNILYSSVFLATNVFHCIPLSFFWNQFDGTTQGLCFSPVITVKITLGLTAITAMTDWAFGLLPIWLLWNLHLKKQKKILVCILLGLGALASAAPLVRLPYTAGLLNNADILWAGVDVAIWCAVEIGVGIVVISLHTLRPLFTSLPFFARLSTGSSRTAPSISATCNRQIDALYPPGGDETPLQSRPHSSAPLKDYAI